MANPIKAAEPIYYNSPSKSSIPPTSPKKVVPVKVLESPLRPIPFIPIPSIANHELNIAPPSPAFGRPFSSRTPLISPSASPFLTSQSPSSQSSSSSCSSTPTSQLAHLVLQSPNFLSPSPTSALTPSINAFSLCSPANSSTSSSLRSIPVLTPLSLSPSLTSTSTDDLSLTPTSIPVSTSSSSSSSEPDYLLITTLQSYGINKDTALKYNSEGFTLQKISEVIQRCLTITIPKGSYLTTINDTQFIVTKGESGNIEELHTTYNAKLLGSGASAEVREARPLIGDRHLALKLLNNPKKKQHLIKNTLKILNNINNEGQVLGIPGAPQLVKMLSENPSTEEVCVGLLMEQYETDLMHFFRYYPDLQRMDAHSLNEIIVGIIYQIVVCLTHIQKKHINHGDIKPGNILVNGNIAELCDWDNARYTRDCPNLNVKVKLIPDQTGTPKYTHRNDKDALSAAARTNDHKTYAKVLDSMDVFAAGMTAFFAGTRGKHFPYTSNQREPCHGELNSENINYFKGLGFPSDFFSIILQMCDPNYKTRLNAQTALIRLQAIITTSYPNLAQSLSFDTAASSSSSSTTTVSSTTNSNLSVPNNFLESASDSRTKTLSMTATVDVGDSNGSPFKSKVAPHDQSPSKATTRKHPTTPSKKANRVIFSPSKAKSIAFSSPTNSKQPRNTASLISSPTQLHATKSIHIPQLNPDETAVIIDSLNASVNPSALNRIPNHTSASSETQLPTNLTTTSKRGSRKQPSLDSDLDKATKRSRIDKTT